MSCGFLLPARCSFHNLVGKIWTPGNLQGILQLEVSKRSHSAPISWRGLNFVPNGTTRSCVRTSAVAAAVLVVSPAALAPLVPPLPHLFFLNARSTIRSAQGSARTVWCTWPCTGTIPGTSPLSPARVSHGSQRVLRSMGSSPTRRG